MKPIEAVMFWADGNDLAWVEERMRTRSGQQFTRTQLDSAARYRDWGLLGLVLASLLKNAPWLSRVTLLTPGHVPADLAAIQALNPAMPIRVIAERDFVPAKYLPMYNGFAHETFLHAIDDLAENLLFLSDDMIFLWPTLRSDYATDRDEILLTPPHHWDAIESEWGLPPSHPLRRVARKARDLHFALFGFRERHSAGEQFHQTMKFSRRLFESRFPGQTFQRVPHFPFVLSKRDLAAVDRHFRVEIERCRQNKFRGVRDTCVLSLALSIARAERRTLVRERAEALFNLSRDARAVRATLEEAARYTVVCLNDGGAGDEPVPDEVSSLLADYVRTKLADFSRPT